MLVTVAFVGLGVLMLLSVAALAAVVLGLVAARPNTFRVARTVSIAAPPERIYPLIVDFQEWTRWSPYEKLDPGMKRAYGAVAGGTGATYAWEGNASAGAGRMEILEAAQPSRVLIKLDFSKPFEGHNQAEFTIAPEGDVSTVTWAMSGPVPFMMKALHLVVNMDKMLGRQFDEGLANLKHAVET